METLRLRNYRCFSDTSEIELKPVNILLGKNSVGKSSFLKFFPLLKQSRLKHPNGIFLWYADDVDFKDFKNTVKNGEENIVIELKFKRKLIDHSISNYKNRKTKPIDISFALTLSNHPNDENLDYLSNLWISFNDISINLTFTPVDDRRFLQPLKELSINGRVADVEAGPIPQVSEDGFIPKIYFRKKDGNHVFYTPNPEIEFESEILKTLLKVDDSDDVAPGKRGRSLSYRTAEELTRLYASLPKKVAKLFNSPEDFIENVYLQQLNNIIGDINDYVEDLARNIYYIQPVRANAKRYYRLQNLAVDEIDSHGDNLPMYLNSLSKDAKRRLNNWMQPLFKFELGVEPKEGHIQINIIEIENKETDTPVIRNLVDVGFGYSQLLPIIVQIWNALQNKRHRSTILRKTFDNPKIIVIEQPELHLHPRMMAYFAEMLISILKEERDNVRFIIETHSETLIDSIGRKISRVNNDLENRDQINSEDFQVLIFNKEKETSTTEIMTTRYDSNGFIEAWPYGFFSGD